MDAVTNEAARAAQNHFREHRTIHPSGNETIVSEWPTIRPECEPRLGVHVLQPLYPVLGAPHIFKPLGILKTPTQQRLAGRPRGRVNLSGQGRPPLQGGEGLNVV